MLVLSISTVLSGASVLTAAASMELLNEGFEEDNVEWSGAYKIQTDDVYLGEKSCMLISGPEGDGGISRPFICLEPKRTYEFRIAVKRMKREGSVTATCRYLGVDQRPLMSSKNWTAGMDVPVMVTGDLAMATWKVFSGIIRCDRQDFGGVSLEIKMTNGSGTVLIDQIEIHEIALPEAPPWKLPEAVLFEGHPSRYGMEVMYVQALDSVFHIETTGAIYTLDAAAGLMNCYQKGSPDRAICSVKFSHPFNLEIVTNTPDVCVLQDEDICFGFQGDSLVTVATNNPLAFSVTSFISARYFRRNDQHMIAIDDRGGFCVMPHTREEFADAGSLITDPPKSTDKSGWGVDYIIGPKEMVGISVFPPKPFNWERSFALRVVMAMQPPSSGVLERYSQYATVLSLFTGTYIGSPQERYHTPYQVKNGLELEKSINHAHQLGMKVLMYRHMMSYVWAGENMKFAYEDMKRFRDAFGFDGWYLDGLFVDNSWLDSYRFVRMLRDDVGDGVIYTHSTRNPPRQSIDLYCPFIDAYSDFLLRGEGQDIDGKCDPLLRYVVGTYNISNSFATLKGNRFFRESLEGRRSGRQLMPIREQLEVMLQLNGRCRWAYPEWPLNKSDREDYIGFYYIALDRLRLKWKRDKKPLPIIWHECESNISK